MTRVTPPAGPASTSNRILGIAADHLRRFGLARITVTGVAAEAGMAHANVYRFFPSKTAMVDAVTAQWLRILDNALVATADAPDPADDKLERMLLEVARTYREKAEKDPKLFEALLQALAAGRPIARQFDQRMRTLVERVVDEGISAGTFGKERARAVTLVFDVAYRFITPAAILADLHDAQQQMDSRRERVMRTLLASLQSRM
jgi:AcrR family transcriptional regulator